MSGFTAGQVAQLLKPIHNRRVLRDGKNHSHVSQQDVTAHLIRMFGFGGFDTEVLSVECIFETERVNTQTGAVTGRWDCCYRALLRLTIRDADGNEICHYEDGSTATAQNQTRGDAHDLAYKSAISLAKKRAAINLGDQFGLSLYNKGQLAALVMGTMVMPPGDEPESETDVQEGVAQQVSMGHDEVDRELDASTEAFATPASPAPETDFEWVEGFDKTLNKSTTAQALKERWAELVAAHKAGRVTDEVRKTFEQAITERKNELAQMRGAA